MRTEHLVYSLIQITHNFGGALALGAPLFWLLYNPPAEKQRLALKLLAFVWTLQGITGALFIVASLQLYGALPELTKIGLVAIGMKIAFVTVAVIITFSLLIRKDDCISPAIWMVLTTLGAIGMVAAGILRWNT